MASDRMQEPPDPLLHLQRSLQVSLSDDLLPDVGPAQPPSIAKEVIEISFPLLASPVKLSVDPSPGCGGVTWPAGEVLSQYIIRRGSLRNKTVVELGSGTGLVGLVAGLLEANVCITDQQQLLDLMLVNVALNNLSHNVTALELNWGEPLPLDLPAQPDLILAADCVYFEPAFPLLVQTLSYLCTSSTTEVLFCYKKRRKADRRFFALLKKKFSWIEVTDDPDREVYSKQAISLLRLVKKS
ncbi:hypothetical protein BOTBODRAFT_60705 [Botryobasidium botryosum FD-172 SS1]|uniref:Protein-lysine N-methyltransferase EFM6 n=1 Tax=Botryobasidium botryosum (strain FD-172 SS1) TaxID=930990 RepID=A0A067M312_BOTB1|nr:hypothetical protein BOTBODRAFT_60705 [Botryobasidium botryosum FD-172 SS1]